MNDVQLTTINQLEFLSTICGALKSIKRTGWVRSGVPLPESDADHMHRCAMCAMMVEDVDVNHVKLLRMALTHDLCEALAGDVTPFCEKSKVENKHEAERQAMERINEMVGEPLGGELMELWKEYEAQESVEAIYCKDIDKFEMIMQAYEYEKMHLKQKDKINHSGNENDIVTTTNALTEPLRTFFITTQKKMKTSMFKRLDAELRSKREAMLSSRGWNVTDDEK